jgi:Zn-dependent protease
VVVAAVICFGWLISICLHEFGHALVAYKGGDTSVKDKGYLTLNIFKYTDPQVTLIFPVLILILGGIALPGAAVYIDHSRLRNRLWESAVSAAGPYASSVVGVLFSAPFFLNLQLPGAPWLMPALAFLVLLSFVSVIFNLLPVPGFDGFGIIYPWLPKDTQRTALKYRNAWLFIVLAAIWLVPGFNDTLWGIAGLFTQLLGVPHELIQQGAEQFFAHRIWLGVMLIGGFFLVYRKNTGNDAPQLYQKARQLFATNQPEQALSTIDAALTKQPASPECWHLRALCLGILRRNEEAIASFNRALALKPDYADCWYNKACCYALQGQTDAALASLGQAIAISKSSTLKEHARQDVGFSSMLEDPRFQRLVGEQA